MILDQYGNPVCSGSRNFASAADRADRSRPPEPLYKDDFDKLIPDYDRQFIVSGSRKLFQNFGPVTGALIQKADNVVGRAWSPKFVGQDREWGAIARDWLENQWYGNCDVRGRAWDFKTLLWLDSVAMGRDGDCFIYLTEGASGYPLTQRISVNRVGQRNGSSGGKVADGPYKGSKISHGVILDKFNRAIAYRVLGDTAAEDRDIPADRMIPVMDPLWHDQVRGIPSTSPAIKLIYGSLTATEREQMNQLIRASYALVEYNDTGGPNLDDPSVALGQAATGDTPATPTVESLAGGMIKYFRSNSGGKLETIESDTPGDMWDRFQDRVVRTFAAAINWPYELFWKANEVNAALVRNIQERARMSVEDQQDVLKSPALFQIRYAIAKAIKVGILPKPKNAADWWKWDFQMPRKFSVDLAKDAQQRREDFKLGLCNRTGMASDMGLDAEVLEDERIEEVFRRRRKIREAKKNHPDDAEGDDREFFMLTANDTAQTDKSSDPAGGPNADQQDETTNKDEE